MYKLRDWYTKLNAVQNGVVGTHGIIKDIVKTVGFEVLKIFPKGYFSKKIVDNSKKYADTNTYDGILFSLREEAAYNRRKMRSTTYHIQPVHCILFPQKKPL